MIHRRDAEVTQSYAEVFEMTQQTEITEQTERGMEVEIGVR